MGLFKKPDTDEPKAIFERDGNILICTLFKDMEVVPENQWNEMAWQPISSETTTEKIKKI